jgi:putative SOS response-associated peptidase YedK
MSAHNPLEPPPRERTTTPRGAGSIMCGRYTIAPSREALAERFHAGLSRELLTPPYHAAPSQALPAIFKTNPHALTVSAWGFIPAWANGKPAIPPLINGS